jgi:hypothetical protein
MFGYKMRKFAFNWVVVLLVLVIGASAALGYNSITRSLDLFAGFGALGSLFGGLPTLGGILVVLLGLAAVTWLFIHMTKTNYDDNKNRQVLHIVVALAVIVAALFIGVGWIEVTSEFWPTVGTIIAILVVVTGATALVTDRTKKVVSTVTAH